MRISFLKVSGKDWIPLEQIPLRGAEKGASPEASPVKKEGSGEPKEGSGEPI